RTCSTQLSTALSIRLQSHCSKVWSILSILKFPEIHPNERFKRIYDKNWKGSRSFITFERSVYCRNKSNELSSTHRNGHPWNISFIKRKGTRQKCSAGCFLEKYQSTAVA